MRPRLPLNNLNAFASAAASLSFQAAAEQLHVTPSAVSHQIRNLEQRLGHALFERLDKRVALTARGQRLYDDIREPIRQLHAASARALRGQDDHRLALSVAPVFATRWLMPRLQGFYLAHPEINLSVIATTDLLDFRSDDIDAAIRLGPGAWSGTRAELLFHPEMGAVCSPALLERHGGVLGTDALDEVTLIDNAGMPGLWDQWFASFGTPARPRTAGLRVQNSAQALEAIQSGDCVGLVDLNLIRAEIETGRVALANPHTFTARDAYYLVVPHGGPSSPAQDAFRQWLVDAVAECRRAQPLPIAGAS